MKRPYLILALLALILPTLLRVAWFYRGTPDRAEIPTPDYASFTRPEVTVNQPNLDDVPQLKGTVLLDGYHANQFYLNEIESLTASILARGGNVETVTDSYSFETQLKYASAFISISPGLSFSTYEAQLLKTFTERGGRILVLTDATRNAIYFDYFSGNPVAASDATAANSLLKHFDISINNDYLYNTSSNEGNFRNVFFGEFAKNELTFGLDTVALYGAHSVESPSGMVLLKGEETNLSSANDAHNSNAGGAALSADGNVAAFGDLTFLSSPYSTYNDNAALIQNLADFVLSGERSQTLDVYPFIFASDTVKVYISPNIQKTPTLVTAMAALQNSMRYLDITVEFVDELPSSGDVILVGTFDDAAEDLNSLRKIGVEIDSETINSIEFGEISRFGNGLVLFETGSKGNRLALLADTTEDLLTLMGVAGGGSLTSCLTSAQVAVCSVGFGDYGFDTGETFEETPVDAIEETDPEATPTPSG
ncbi:MAG: hypothetical protein J0L96_12960 [Anaerolineae bacterium]|nr:hypothetical protein [Anaerolineae bacterium]